MLALGYVAIRKKWGLDVVAEQVFVKENQHVEEHKEDASDVSDGRRLRATRSGFNANAALATEARVVWLLCCC